MQTFSEILVDFYRTRPEQTALTLLLTGKEDQPVSVRALLDGSWQYAAALREAGVKPGEVVILILQHSAELVYAYFGTILNGSIPSIMPFLTEKLLPERYRADLASLFSVTQPEAVITYPEFESEVRAITAQNSSVHAVLVTGQMGGPADPAGILSAPGLRRQPDDTVLLQHSSGTTGLQKGVALTHRAVFNQLTAYRQALSLTDQDVIVSWLPLYHDMGLIAGFLMPILSGVPLVLMSPFDWVRAPVRLLRAVSDYRGTLCWIPNFAYNFCAQKIRERDLAGVDLSSLRAVINCSEPMRWESQHAFHERFAPYGLKESALATCYAMAENVFAVTQGGLGQPPLLEYVNREALQTELVARPAQEGDLAVSMFSTGRPLPNVQIRILDDQGRPLPDRRVGEVALFSDCMLKEYYRRSDATEKAFRDGWYLTGDYGYTVNGELFINGRKKDLIIVGGKNIYPQDLELLAGEVEGVHPGRVVAFGVFNQDAGTEDVVMVAEVETPDEEERERLSDQIRQVVTRGSAVALRHVQVVGAHWLIKTSSGKIARSANRDKFLKEFGLG